MDSGNSFSGCALCLAATTLYSLVAIVISSLDCKVTELLALEGLYSFALLVLALALDPWGEGNFFDTNLSGAKSFIFLCMNDLMLNLGWFWCSKLMGASQTAMLACLSIPLSLLLDAILLGSIPSISEALGSLLAIIGFFLSYTTTVQSKSNSAQGADMQSSLCTSNCAA